MDILEPHFKKRKVRFFVRAGHHELPGQNGKVYLAIYEDGHDLHGPFDSMQEAVDYVYAYYDHNLVESTKDASYRYMELHTCSFHRFRHDEAAAISPLNSGMKECTLDEFKVAVYDQTTMVPTLCNYSSNRYGDVVNKAVVYVDVGVAPFKVCAEAHQSYDERVRYYLCS